MLVLCSRGRAEEIHYLIHNYFAAGRTVTSAIDLRYLAWYLSNEERSHTRSLGLKHSSQTIFEKSLLEQRLLYEIITMLETGKGFVETQVSMSVNDPEKEEYKEIYSTNEEDNQTQTQNLAMQLVSSGYYVSNEQNLYENFKMIHTQFEIFLPMLLSKLILIPEKMASDCLKMLRVTDLDETGKFKTTPFVTPGVNLKVLSFEALNRDLSILQEFKPDNVIMFDQNNYFLRHFQFSNMLDHRMEVMVLVGESYLEGYLFKARDKREDQTFVKLTKAVARLHGVNNRAIDRIKLDSGLKLVSRKEGENKNLSVSSINPDGPVVLVDKREFNSETPSLLYFAGYKVLPMFLKIGDYILSNDIVIERKAFEDFKQSIRSGRLDQQIKQMMTTFSKIYVIIEFYHNHTLEEMNNYLANRRIAETISVYRNCRMASRYPLNMSGLIQLYNDRFPAVKFLYAFKEQDTLAYFKYLKQKAKGLDLEKFGEYSKKLENKTKKLDDYFKGIDDNDKAGSKNNSEGVEQAGDAAEKRDSNSKASKE